MTDTRRRDTGILVALMIVATALMTWGLFDRGIILWDEGSYLMEGRFIASATRAVAWKFGAKIIPGVPTPSAEDLRALVGGIPPVAMGKPGHAALVGIAMLIFGDHTWAPAVVSIICALVIIALVYRIGCRYIGPSGALVAVFILSLSPYMLFYSRVGLAEMDFALAGLLLMLILWRLVSEERPFSIWDACKLGLIVGVAFLLNYRAFILIALAGLWIIVLLIRQKTPLAASIGRIACTVSSFLAVLCITEALYRVGAAVGNAIQPDMPFETYFQRLHWLATAHGGEPPTLANLPTFVYLFMMWEAPAAILLIIGTVAAMRRRTMQDWLLLSFFYLPMLQWSIRADGYARLAVLNLPAYALLAGVGFVYLQGRMPVPDGLSCECFSFATHWRKFAVRLLLLFAILAVARDVVIIQAKSAHELALQRSAENGATMVVDTNSGIGVVFDDIYPLEAEIRLPEKPDEALTVLRRARDGGAQYLITDMQRFIGGTQLMSLDRYQRTACYIIENTYEPIWQAPDKTGLFFNFCFEHNWGFAQTLKIYREYHEHADTIRLYRIEDAIAALEGHASGGPVDAVISVVP